MQAQEAAPVPLVKYQKLQLKKEALQRKLAKVDTKDWTEVEDNGSKVDESFCSIDSTAAVNEEDFDEEGLKVQPKARALKYDNSHKPIEGKSEAKAKAHKAANLKLIGKVLRSMQGQDDDQRVSTDGSLLI
jgi:hypothetical protein